MNDKIIRVIEKILSSKSKIEDVRKDGNEIFFKFGGQIMSVLKRGSNSDIGEYGLYFYPGSKGSIEEVIEHNAMDPESLDMVFFNDKDFPTQREQLLFPELYKLLEGQVSGIDDILNDILDA